MQFIRVTDFSNKVTFINAEHIFSIEPWDAGEGTENSRIVFLSQTLSGVTRIVRESPAEIFKQIDKPKEVVHSDYRTKIEKLQKAIKDGAQS